MKTKNYLQVQGRMVSFFDTGEKHNNVIVLLSAFPLTKECWNEQVELLSTSYRIISFDYAGIGDSPHTSSFVTIDSHVVDLMEVLNHCNVEKFSVLGISMGGYVALRATYLFPERIQSLILANTRSDADSNSDKTKHFEQIKSLQTGDVKSFATSLANTLLSEDYKHRRPEALNLLITFISKQSVNGLCGNLMAVAARYNANEYLGKIKCPVLIITGDNDNVISYKEGQNMKDQIEGSKMVILANCGHRSNFEQPELFLKTVEDFLINEVLNISEVTI